MTQTPDHTPDLPPVPDGPGSTEVPDAPAPDAPAQDAPGAPDAPAAPEAPRPETPDLPDDEIVPLLPPDPADSELPTPDDAEPEPEPFTDGPPPLPKPLLVLDGELPPEPEPEPVEEVDHGTCTCGGRYDEDGWCTECGERRPDPRHHFTAQADERVAGVCDRGIRHDDNEDAMAVWAGTGPDGSHRAALVACDGVTTATRSAEASLAAAYAALEALTTSEETPEQRLGRAADAAAAAVEEVGMEFPGSAPSCTLVMALVEDGVATVGNVGDSRAYWIPDEGEPRRLTRDDSMAEEQVDSGVDRATAEAGPLAHTITRWLGADSPDHEPSVSTQEVSAPGWLMACTDGLWNYASAPADLRAVLRAERQRVGDDPLDLAGALVAWAKTQGGADNITVTLARTGPAQSAPAHGDAAGGVRREQPEEDRTRVAGQDGHHG